MHDGDIGKAFMEKQMTTSKQKGSKTWRITTSVMALALMALGADVVGQHEVIFPEIAALAMGLWIADKRMWDVSGYEIPLLMTVSAVLGVLITTYLEVHIFVQLTLAFAISATMMTACRVPLIPAIAAILLPVLLHTTSWYYPASVAVMTTIMAIGTPLLIRWGMKAPLPAASPHKQRRPLTAREWTLRYLMLLPLLAVCAWQHWLFAIVPPLVIILIELANTKNMFRGRPLTLWACVVVVATIGTLSRWLMLEALSMPYVVAVSVAFLLAILLLTRARLMFPPVPALAVIPFILPASYLWFPIEVMLGGAYVIGVPLLISKANE